jgi:hypothetical protein
MTVIIWIFVKKVYRMLLHKSNQPIENRSFKPLFGGFEYSSALILLSVIILVFFSSQFLIDFLKNALN